MAVQAAFIHFYGLYIFMRGFSQPRSELPVSNESGMTALVVVCQSKRGVIKRQCRDIRGVNQVQRANAERRGISN